MKTPIAVAALFIAIGVPAWAEEAKKPDAAAQQSSAAAANNVEYRPPTRGAPRVRVGGSTRSLARALSLSVIAPDHAGLSATESPDLYWYISRPVETPLEFSIGPVDAAEPPLVETSIPPVREPGIQRIRLADMKVRLKPGEEYVWVISFASKPGARAKDAIASGRVKVQPGGKMDSYAAYARAGYWYDAFAALREDIARHPRDAKLAAAQQSLLEQVGLDEVARRERARLTEAK
jgi:uncharacterized protein DUF928